MRAVIRFGQMLGRESRQLRTSSWRAGGGAECEFPWPWPFIAGGGVTGIGIWI